MGLDPGIRTGVKVAVVDATGKVLATDTVYPFQPKNDLRGAQVAMAQLIGKHGVELISIGNGTASRETEKMVARSAGRAARGGKAGEGDRVRGRGLGLFGQRTGGEGISRSGRVACAARSSIARRLQDPLAELVKIEPKAIGVGQYQHDVDQHRLGRSPGGGGRRCGERGRGRSEHRLGALAGAGVGRGAGAGRGDRRPPRRQRAVCDAGATC